VCKQCRQQLTPLELITSMDMIFSEFDRELKRQRFVSCIHISEWRMPM
jgi:hypothetical protein